MARQKGTRRGGRISRRDFLNGVAVGAAGLIGARSAGARPRALAEPAPYPPLLTGMRGSHPGSETVAHALRDGVPLSSFGAGADTGEVYDLVIVGAGISGLAAAHFFRKAHGDQARILILENHDDVGGHARRNEFRHGAATWIGYGGAIAIDSPRPYSAVAHGLIQELGIQPRDIRLKAARERLDPMAMRRGFFFDRETFGRDRLLIDPRSGGKLSAAEVERGAWDAFLAEAPLTEAAKRDLRALYRGPDDPMPGVPSTEKKARLARISYERFLTEHLKLDAGVVKVLAAATHDLYGVGIDAVPAQDAWGLGLPGFNRMQLSPEAGPGMNHDAAPGESSYYYHFPDGNASIVRLLLRRLVPGSVPGGDIVSARLDYSALDLEGAPCRVRVASTVGRVRHVGSATRGQDVEVAYVTGGRLATVRAGACVMACWGGVIPYICHDVPAAQKEALAFGAKVPLLYTNVFLRNWRAFQQLGVRSVSAPGSYHTSMSLSHAMMLGKRNAATGVDDPAVLHMGKTPNKPGLPARDQHRAGRMELLSTPFEAIEAGIRDQLTRTLGAGGFDAARDILAITVNRWSHGYAYQYNSLWDPFWLEGAEEPCIAARRPFGRIAIANADSGAYAYCDSAIDQAHRAVRELLG